MQLLLKLIWSKEHCSAELSECCKRWLLSGDEKSVDEYGDIQSWGEDDLGDNDHDDNEYNDIIEEEEIYLTLVIMCILKMAF